MDGYEIMHNGRCYTVFSAPNYCDQMGNKGAYMVMYGPDLKDPECIPFSEVDHPQVKPMQVSLGFCALKASSQLAKNRAHFF